MGLDGRKILQPGAQSVSRMRTDVPDRNTHQYMKGTTT